MKKRIITRGERVSSRRVAGFGFKAFAAVFVFTLGVTGCDEFLPGGEEDPPESGAAEGAFVFVTAESGAVTTALTPVFDAAAEGLTAEDITFTASGGNSGITPGRLRPGGSPFVYTPVMRHTA
ncbi:MAG: hypothetical protein LBG27_08160 [Spirochaetaceae bacterium]|nr:hypothetical protein [Spirochaetaceae bacterium]